MNKNILILGNGFVGMKLKEALACNITAQRVNSLKDAQKLIDRYKPRIIINCIGHVGRNVDDCELDADKTLQSNSFVPLILAEAAIRNNLKLIHISSGCIFHFDYKKDKPITENKEPDFFELFYSRSKIYPERALEVLSKRFNILILRIRVPLDNEPHPRNLLTKLINYKKIVSLPNSVTYMPEFTQALKHLIKINARGIYNIASKGALDYIKLMKAYKKINPGFSYTTVDFKKLNLVRTNLVLSVRKIEKTGFKLKNINEVIKECVRAYVKYS